MKYALNYNIILLIMLHSPSRWWMYIYHSQLASKIFELFYGKSLSKHICQLESWRDVLGGYKTTIQLLLNEMSVYLYVLCSVMLNWIVCNTDGRLIITHQTHRSFIFYFEIVERNRWNVFLMWFTNVITVIDCLQPN